jgi:asparagine synthase (glutamine-hydrolysing)
MCGIVAVFGKNSPSIVSHLPPHGLSHRGPDYECILDLELAHMEFYRLCIMDPSSLGNQPFTDSGVYVMCNGEIYNYKDLIRSENLFVKSQSDCEVILRMYLQGQPPETIVRKLYGVFAFVIYDTITVPHRVIVARDRIGVRPLFFFYDDNTLVLASEAKVLSHWSHLVFQFPSATVSEYLVHPHYTLHHYSTVYWELPRVWMGNCSTNDRSCLIQSLLYASVERRMDCHRGIGCLLSGGLDSSLIAGILVKLLKQRGSSEKLRTYSVGMPGSTDLHYARIVAGYLDTDHHEVLLSETDFLNAVPKVVECLESFDTTTVRASVGMYLVCQYINKNTPDVKVIFSGEGSDEVCQGYLYFHLQNSALSGDMESRRLIRELPYFDVLRADRTTAAWGLELREPFLDTDFIEYFLSLPPQVRCPQNGVEKWALRTAFKGTDLIPHEILWRKKEAFSDGVSSVEKSWSWVISQFLHRNLGLFTGKTVLDKNHLLPSTLEEQWYRLLFDEYYPGMSHLVPHFWKPQWTKESDPSARKLTVY